VDEREVETNDDQRKNASEATVTVPTTPLPKDRVSPPEEVSVLLRTALVFLSTESRS